MDLKSINNVFFIGIGGIGMSALARYFLFIGKSVCGYDRTITGLTRELEAEGIAVSYNYASETIPENCKNPVDTLVVYTPAVPLTIPLMIWFKKQGFSIMKRAHVLGLLTIARKGVCIAGTHGKTTVSTMVGHLLKNSWLGCSAFLGGISINYNTNLLVSTESNYVVIEADEYDRSFHSLNPYFAVITSVDPDHLDIYGSVDALKESFRIFTTRIKSGGTIIIKKGIELKPDLNENVNLVTYSLDEEADFYAQNIRIESGNYVFDLVTQDNVLKNMVLGMPGKINLENAVAALAVACLLGCSNSEMQNGIMSFRGIKRRFEYHFKTEDAVYIDDYAHHPQEIKATLNSIKELYPNKKVSAVFQPHLFSRTRDFASEFAESLSVLDELILMEIYPAREEPISGITANSIFKNVSIENKILITKYELLDEIKKRKPELLVTMGAGDIGEEVQNIKAIMQQLYA